MEQANIKKTKKKLNKIFLIGFMCSGKTVAGKLLAKRLNLKFKDSDKEIEKIYKKKISAIIQEDGINYFRQIEEKTVKKLINKQNIIIAMGGGIMSCKPWPEYLKGKGLSVYLSCSIEELKKRLLIKENTRPQIGKDSAKKTGDAIKKLLIKRLPYYNKADLKLSVTKLSPTQTARKIEKLIIYAKED
ncbi:MAG: AAA family ATPase [Elusimicrobia bacterium]|nr:AAA family ATPase [Elusimicrobiota bacterium]